MFILIQLYNLFSMVSSISTMSFLPGARISELDPLPFKIPTEPTTVYVLVASNFQLPYTPEIGVSTPTPSNGEELLHALVTVPTDVARNCGWPPLLARPYNGYGPPLLGRRCSTLRSGGPCAKLSAVIYASYEGVCRGASPTSDWLRRGRNCAGFTDKMA